MLAALLLTNPPVAIAGARTPMVVRSADLPAGRPWPGRMMLAGEGCTGRDVSPELHWRGAPPGTRSFAITLYDPFRPPASGWWHWIVYDIPASVDRLPRGAGAAGSRLLPGGARQARPDGPAPEPRYYGPCPTKGDAPHPYRITVHALKVATLDIPAAATPAFVAYVIAANTLAEATIVRPLTR